MPKTTPIQQEIKRLNEQFLHSSDFTAKEIAWAPGEQAILCFYSSLVKKSEVEKYLYLLRPLAKTSSSSESNTAQDDSDMQMDEQNEPNPENKLNQENNNSEQNEANQKNNNSEQTESKSENNNSEQIESNQKNNNSEQSDANQDNSNSEQTEANQESHATKNPTGNVIIRQSRILSGNQFQKQKTARLDKYSKSKTSFIQKSNYSKPQNRKDNKHHKYRRKTQLYQDSKHTNRHNIQCLIRKRMPQFRQSDTHHRNRRH